MLAKQVKSFTPIALRVSSQSARTLAAPALAEEDQTTSAPFTWKLQQKYYPVGVPQSEPLPNFPEVDQSREVAGAAEVETTVLENGVKVVSVNGIGANSTVTGLVGVGARHENDANSGSSHLLSHILLKGSSKRSALRIQRDLENMGGYSSSLFNRESMMINVDGLKSFTAGVGEMVAEAIADADISGDNFGDAVLYAARDTKASSENDVESIDAMLHRTAFGGRSVGNELFISEYSRSARSVEDVQAFYKENLSGNKVVFSGVNVDHKTLVEAVAEQASAIPATSTATVEKAAYVGGEALDVKSGAEYVGIGFQGSSWTDKDFFASCVALTLLGGGESFSSGGPGKGVHSDLYTQILGRKPWALSAMAIASSFQDSGMFAVMGSALPGYANDMAKSLVERLQALGTGATDEQVARAKAMTASNYAMNLENNSIQSEEIARQSLVFGGALTNSEVLASFEKVSTADVRNFLKKVLKSNPSVVGRANRSVDLPTFEQITRML